MKFQPFAIRFDDRREAELVLQALEQLLVDQPGDTLRVRKMHELIDRTLEDQTL